MRSSVAVEWDNRLSPEKKKGSGTCLQVARKGDSIVVWMKRSRRIGDPQCIHIRLLTSISFRGLVWLVVAVVAVVS